MLKRFIQLLRDLVTAIKASQGIKFYSVSLLLTYDSSQTDEQLKDIKCNGNDGESFIKLRLIDFAKTMHIQESSAIDTDLLTGVENLLKCFTFIQENPEIKPFLH